VINRSDSGGDPKGWRARGAAEGPLLQLERLRARKSAGGHYEGETEKAEGKHAFAPESRAKAGAPSWTEPESSGLPAKGTVLRLPMVRWSALD
jgi:hypothetical protein